ncbi:hypothetical protein M5D96_000502, partial [Drosophila gunungcola]
PPFSWSYTLAGLPRLSRLSGCFLLATVKSERRRGFWQPNPPNFFL